jgi:hypothetical protein
MSVLVPMALLGATAASQPPQIDALPPLPPAPRGAAKAVFDVMARAFRPFGLRALEMAQHSAIVRFVRVQGEGG